MLKEKKEEEDQNIVGKCNTENCNIRWEGVSKKDTGYRVLWKLRTRVANSK